MDPVEAEQRQLGADERVPIDRRDRVPIERQYLQLAHVSEVEVAQRRDFVSGQRQRLQVAQQSERLERNATEMVVAEIESLEAVLEAPERQKVQLVEAVVTEQETLDFDAEEVADVDLTICAFRIYFLL